MILWSLLIAPCLWRRCRSSSRFRRCSCALVGSMLGSAFLGSSSPIDGSKCTWNAASVCGRLIPASLLRNASQYPNRSCRSNLFKSGCCRCAFGFVGLLGAHVGWRRRDMRREFWSGRGVCGWTAYFRPLKESSLFPAFRVFFVFFTVLSSVVPWMPHAAKATSVNKRCDIYLNIGVFTYNGY